jgi:hypothetical protein
VLELLIFQQTTQKMEQPLSNEDIIKALNGRTYCIYYKDLHKFTTPEQMLSRFGNVVILYPSRQDGLGHWTCLLYTTYRKKRVIEFFDPYGIEVDKEFNVLGKKKHPRYLANLLLRSSHPVHFNEHPFQEMEDDINTCGRHVICRIMFASLPLKKYADMLKKRGVTPDEAVTSIINVNVDDDVYYYCFPLAILEAKPNAC